MSAIFPPRRRFMVETAGRAIVSVVPVAKHKRTSVRARVSALARAIRPVMTGEGQSFERCGSWRQLRL
jgi:hypothetical protein